MLGKRNIVKWKRDIPVSLRLINSERLRSGLARTDIDKQSANDSGESCDQELLGKEFLPNLTLIDLGTFDSSPEPCQIDFGSFDSYKKNKTQFAELGSLGAP